MSTTSRPQGVARMLRHASNPLTSTARPVTDYIYVIDPLGNVVLRYAQDAEPGRMIKDLTRLLKTSRIG